MAGMRMVDAVSPLLVLQARAEARAILYAAGELDFPNPCTTDVQAAQAGRAGAAIPRHQLDELQAAIEPLLQYALDSGIVDKVGAERAFGIIKQAFAGVAEL
jgi:hypothetical protein